MLRYILLALALYVVYKVVFDVIIPIFRVSRKVHRQFRDMQDQMQQQANRTQQAQANNFQKPTPPKKASAGDYIDFEEIK